MKKLFLSLFALAAFTVTFAATVLDDYTDGEQRWFYTGTTTPLEGMPDCSPTIPDECARLYEFNATTQQWEQVNGENNVIHGLRN